MLEIVIAANLDANSSLALLLAFNMEMFRTNFSKIDVKFLYTLNRRSVFKLLPSISLYITTYSARQHQVHRKSP